MKTKRISKKTLAKKLFDELKKKLEQKPSMYLHQLNQLIPGMFSDNIKLLDIVNRFYFCDWHTHVIGGIVIITVTP